MVDRGLDRATRSSDRGRLNLFVAMRPEYRAIGASLEARIRRDLFGFAVAEMTDAGQWSALGGVRWIW